MDLVSAFDNFSVRGDVGCKLDGPMRVHISEVSSPTRLWIQDANSYDIDKMTIEMEKFYSQHESIGILCPEQVHIGMKVAVRAFKTFGRAEVIKTCSSSTGKVRIFFIDYGTTVNISLDRCRRLIDEFGFNRIPRKAIRGALYGIKPIGNTRLWSLSTTESFIKSIFNKIHHIQIVKHHPLENFYEFLLYDGVLATTVNEMLINSGQALKVEVGETPLCLTYPSFERLEKFSIYPTYADRWFALKNDSVDWNGFEEIQISCEQDFEKILNGTGFDEMKNSLLKIIQG